MGKLEGKVALITGAASGIGRATALLFAQEGAKVVAVDIDEAKGRQVIEEIAGMGSKAVFVRANVSQPEDVKAMVQKAVETYGRLDVLFNNAGIIGEQGRVVDQSVENWNRVIAINLTGVFLGMKYGIPAMLKGGGGSIINTSSAAGLVGFAGISAYCAAKGGVIQLTKGVALEYAKQGIRANVICPGTCLTPMAEGLIATGGEKVRAYLEAQQPIGRFGQPEEVARMVLFLASDESSFCTGAPFIVDGGNVAW